MRCVRLSREVEKYRTTPLVKRATKENIFDIATKAEEDFEVLHHQLGSGRRSRMTFLMKLDEMDVGQNGESGCEA